MSPLTPTIPCKYCGIQTISLGTKLCNNCWEVSSRISFMFNYNRIEALVKIVEDTCPGYIVEKKAQ